jgi:hypothetical protein
MITVPFQHVYDSLRGAVADEQALTTMEATNKTA